MIEILIICYIATGLTLVLARVRLLPVLAWPEVQALQHVIGRHGTALVLATGLMIFVALCVVAWPIFVARRLLR